MCLPPLILAAAAMAAGGVMNAAGQAKADHAMTNTFNSERQRQQQFDQQQQGKFQDSLASTQNTLLSPAAQQAAADKRNSAFTAVTKSATPSGSYLPGSGSAPTVVNAGNVAAGKQADARTASLGQALASLGGMNDVMQANNTAIGHNTQDIATLAGERAGSLGVLPAEMTAAKTRGQTLRTLGGLATSIGQMMAGGAAGGGGGMGPLPVSASEAPGLAPGLSSADFSLLPGMTL